VKSDLVAEVERLGGNVADDVWRWLLRNGPHGSDFTWSQTRGNPPGYVGVEHLQRIVAEKAEIDASFPVRASAVVRRALSSTDVNVLRRAIQVAAVIGAERELVQVTALVTHENDLVAMDARSSAFYLRKRLRSARK